MHDSDKANYAEVLRTPRRILNRQQTAAMTWEVVSQIPRAGSSRRWSSRRFPMTEDDGVPSDAVYAEVLDPKSATPSIDGKKFLFTFLMKDGPPLALVIPSQYLFPLAATCFVAANEAHAIAGKLASQQILQSEAIEVHAGEDQLNLHFRLTEMRADLPISITWGTARASWDS